MAKKKSCKINVMGAVGGTLVLVGLLFQIATNNYSKSDTVEIILLVALIGVMASTIAMWTRTAKKYIDFAIEEKFKQKQIKE